MTQAGHSRSPLAPRVVRVEPHPRRFAPRIAAPPEPRGSPAGALVRAIRSVTHVPGQKCYPCSRLHKAIAIAWLRFRLDLDQRPRNEVLLWCIAVAAKLARGIWQVHRKSACFVLVENVEVLAPCSRDILESEVLEAAMARLGPIDAACLGMFLGGANVQQIALARGVSLRSVALLTFVWVPEDNDALCGMA